MTEIFEVWFYKRLKEYSNESNQALVKLGVTYTILLYIMWWQGPEIQATNKNTV